MSGTPHDAKRIVVVDDDTRLIRLIERYLQTAGYACDAADNGEEGLRKALLPSVALVILDLILPPTSGLTVLKQIRDVATVPVLILSARTDVAVRVQALKAGADDYLVKPFNRAELLARVEAVLRRSQAGASVLRAADLEMDVHERVVRRGGRQIALRPTEFRLLEFFLRHKNRVLTRDEIMKNVWGMDFDPGTNLLSVYISYLRRSVDEGSAAALIRTVRRKGFMLTDR